MKPGKKELITSDLIIIDTENASTSNPDLTGIKFMHNEEFNYIIFILGYDLLQERFKILESNECDVVYEICINIADEFIKSEEYQMMNISLYEALVQWIDSHKEIIDKLINDVE